MTLTSGRVRKYIKRNIEKVWGAQKKKKNVVFILAEVPNINFHINLSCQGDLSHADRWMWNRQA
jgi:hypothetical protein